MDFVGNKNLRSAEADVVWPGLSLDNSYAQLPDSMHAAAGVDRLVEPELLWCNWRLGHALGIDLQPQDAIKAFASGHRIPFGASPVQSRTSKRPWGTIDPHHGIADDIALGEHVDPCFQRHHLSLQQREEGSDSTGAELSLRTAVYQLLMGEVLNAIGIQAPRVLAVAYDNSNQAPERFRASMLKVGDSPLTIGAFEHAFRKLSVAELRDLADYAISRIKPALINSDTPYADLFGQVCDQAAASSAQWESVGFIHSKLDTQLTPIDGGMSLGIHSGFMEHYDPDCTLHPFDLTGRYAFSAQPIAVHWNLCRFANVLKPLMRFEPRAARERVQQGLDDFFDRYDHYRLVHLKHQLGLILTHKEDGRLVDELLELIAQDRLNPQLVFGQVRQLTTMPEIRQWLVALFRQRDRANQWVEAFMKRIAFEPMRAPEHPEPMHACTPHCITRPSALSTTVEEVLKGNVGAIDQFLADYSVEPANKSTG